MGEDSTFFGRLLSASRRHQGLVDLVVAAALTVGGQLALTTLTFRGSTALAAASCLACTGAVAFRRAVPEAAALVAVTGVAVYQSVTHDPQGAFVSAAVILVCYAFGRSTLRGGRYLRASFILGTALAVLELVFFTSQQSSAAGAAGAWVSLAVLPAGVGAFLEHRHRLAGQLASAAADLREEQQVRAQRAASEERNRVARDLHDVVAHHVSVMVIQAGAARTVADRPDAAGAALGVVANSGREALAELRRITGVLRRGDDRWTGRPPRLDDLGTLIDRIEGAGVATRLRTEGDLARVSPAINLVAYRIVQEALTNIVKHAGTTTACVDVRIAADSVRVNITNDPTTGPLPGERLPTAGQGLVGMRERLALYGGQLRAGPRPGGGYEVEATLPLGDGSPPQAPALSSELRGAPLPPSRRDRLLRHLDLLLAAGWLAALEAEAFTSAHRHGSLALNGIVVGLMATMGVWRRRRPLPFLLAVCGLAIALSGGLTTVQTATLTGTYTLVVPIYAVAAWENRTRAITGLVVWEVGMIAANAAIGAPAAGVAGAAVMAAIVWTAGSACGSYRRLNAELADTLARLDIERAERERLAIASQRGRIAEDLNSVVACHITDMVVQAEAAQNRRPFDPGIARGEAAALEETGRQALARMREILGVLRVRNTPTDPHPQPGLSQLHQLVQASRNSGRRVDFAIVGEPAPVSGAAELAAYRTIERLLAAEAPPSAELAIALSFSDNGLDLDVTQHGPTDPDWPLAAIRLPLELCHGTVVHHADQPRRWHVQLPYPQSAAPVSSSAG